jgi:hypothetical protein
VDYFILKAKVARQTTSGESYTDYIYYCAQNIVRHKASIDGKETDATTFTCSGRLTVLKTEDIVYIAQQTLPSDFRV